MFQFAVLADHGRLAVAFRPVRRDAQRRHCTLAPKGPRFLADGDQFGQIAAAFASGGIAVATLGTEARGRSLK